MWHGQSLAVVLPTYREKATIRKTIEDLEGLGIVDEIIVVNNNAEQGTSEEVAGTSAREVHEVTQGYGASIRRGLCETEADLVAVMEPDGTFEAGDLRKFLTYSGEFDFVYGSRTTREFIWDGANMGTFLRVGNWAVAKLLQVLFKTPSLSDIGCTMRLASGSALRELQPHYRLYNGAFGPEMMTLSVIGQFRVVQIPINYRARGGAFGTTERFGPAVVIGVQMIRLIIGYRIRRRAIERQLGRTRIAAGRSGNHVAPGPGGEPTHLFPWLRLRRK
jgi:glycosyltransferase involved in cell wall biosynthesis